MTTERKPLYLALAILQARHYNLLARGNLNVGMLQAVRGEIDRLVRQHLPSGSGFDKGVEWFQQKDQHLHTRLSFKADFHPMDDAGNYWPWVTFNVTAEARFDGIDVRVKSANVSRQHRAAGLPDYVAEVFHDALVAEVDAQTDIVG